jgi:hypothetical protein
MSKLALANGDDHPDAAQKHLADATALLSQLRPDGAAYLSGYVVECALKAIWLNATGLPVGPNMPWGKQGHKLGHLLNQVSTLSAMAGARASRYLGSAVASLPSSPLAAWTPEMRYRSPSMTLDDAQLWLKTADELFRQTVAQMFLDGVL